MSEEQADRKLFDLIYEAIVPVGHRPQSDEEIEAMLGVCTGNGLSQEQFDRMLSIVKGEQQIGSRPSLTDALIESQLTDAQRELVALHRAQGKELPPEIQELLAKLRKEIVDKEGEDTGDGKRS